MKPRVDERDASRERPVLAAHDLSESRLPAHHETIEAWVVEWLALHWQMPAGAIDRRRPLVEQGLDSMAAISLAHDLEQWLGLPLSLSFVWQQGSIEALARALASPEVMFSLAPVSESAVVARRNEGTAPASLGQQQLWRQLRPQPESPRFHLHFGLRFDGPLDIEALRLSLQEIVRRHEAFRTSFRERDGELLQVIAPVSRLELPVVDLRAEQEEDLGRALDSASFRTLYDALGRAPFDLQVGPLIRAALVVLTNQTHVLLVTQHRLITDGASLSVFGRELAFLYRVFHARVPSPLAPPSRQASDVARWQRHWLGGEGAHRQREYWRARLDGVPPLKLTPRGACGEEGARVGGLVCFEVPMALTTAWKVLASGEGATLFTALSAVFAALLSRHSGQEDVLLGTVVANRGRRELRDVVGLLANTVALRCDLTGNPSFRELLVRHRRRTTEDLSHQELPFEEVSRLGQGAWAAPTVRAACVFESMAPFDLSIPGLGCALLTDTPDASVPGTARHELTLLLREDLGRLCGAFEYAADVFQPAEVERLAACFRRLLGRIVETPDVRLDDLPLAEDAPRLG
ncbi:condensation domain-containing protein [Myxococcus stipitatus]|uniref:condensation domain-containing protein n=1 Tax=Myxococcus stipitatus TaxID=83455 RepID=UPI0030CCA1BF